MLRDDQASCHVWLDAASGTLEAMLDGAVAVECSTLTVQTIKTIADEAKGRGIAFVDAPVVGSLPHAEAGQLIFMAGGAAPVIKDIEPVLLAMGGCVQYAGDVGSGMATKLIVNALFATQVAVLAELLGMAEKLGIAPQRVMDVISTTPTISPAAKAAGMGMLAKNFSPMYPVELARKDMSYALQEAQGVGGELPMVDAVARVLDAVITAGWGASTSTFWRACMPELTAKTR